MHLLFALIAATTAFASNTGIMVADKASIVRCEKGFRIAGDVRDPAGKPIPHAEIVLDNQTVALTDNNGSFSILRAYHDRVVGLSFTFRASGFKPAQSKPIERREISRKTCEEKSIERHMVLASDIGS